MTHFQYPGRNLRDLGGLRGRRGVVRSGFLFRSAQLDRLKLNEIAMLRELGLVQALDLRDDGEKAAPEARISALLPEVKTLDFPLMGNLKQEDYAAMLEQVRGMESLKDLRVWFGQLYVNMLVRARPLLLSALRHVMETREPQIFFCVAGKDRTGILAMLLLSTLGVDVAAIRRDYTRTNRTVLGLPFLRRNAHVARRQFSHTGLSNKVIDTLADAHPDFLNAAIRSVADAGGIDVWLTGEDGVDDQLVKDFRARMLKA